jgi:hypothetical protein
MQHELFKLALGGRLNLAPLVNPRSALDIGTGTGIWAVDFGKLFRLPFTPNNSFTFLLALLLFVSDSTHSNTTSFRGCNGHRSESNTASIVRVPTFYC